MYYATGCHAALAAYGVKLAAVDGNMFRAFTSKLNPGDVVTWDYPDATGLSKAIQVLTGSPKSHASIYAGKDPRTGQHRLIHNYKDGLGPKDHNGIGYDDLLEQADGANFTAHRPYGVTPKEQRAALAAARSFKPGSSYNYAQLPVQGAYEATKLIPSQRVRGWVRGGLSKLVGNDPRSGVCSTLPYDAYAKAIGPQRAGAAMAGEDLPVSQHRVAVSPASIASSSAMQTVGQYRARGVAPVVPEKLPLHTRILHHASQIADPLLKFQRGVAHAIAPPRIPAPFGK